jgi:cytochrome c oxidase cbb3-type subunit 3
MRLIVFIALPLLAQEPKFNPTAVARGQSQFKSSCGFCHGEDATGNRAPDLIRSASLSHDTNGDVLAPIIKNGRPDKGMPAFSALSDAQIADMIVFLHRRAYDALHSNHVPGDYPLSKLLTGSASDGKKFFEGAGGCAKCHSASGDLRGIARKYSPLDLQQRFLYPSKGAVKTAIVRVGNQTFEGTLVHADEFEIGITVKDGWYRSWPRSRVQVEIRDPLDAHRALMPKYSDADVHNIFAYLETLQ